MKQDSTHIQILEEQLKKDPANKVIRNKLAALSKKKILPALMSSNTYMLNMITDKNRNIFYEKILDKTVSNKKVLEIGTGVGVVSCLLEKSEVKEAVSCEANPYLFDIAKKVLKKNNCEKIKLVNKLSFDLEDSHHGEYDFIVQELFSNDAFSESILEIIEHAKLFLNKGGKVIPGVFKIWAQPIKATRFLQEKRVGEIAGYDFSDCNTMLFNRLVTVKDMSLLDPENKPIKVFEIDLNSEIKMQDKFTLNVSELGDSEGFILYFSLEDQGEVLTSYPVKGAHCANHWEARALLLDKSKASTICFSYNKANFSVAIAN